MIDKIYHKNNNEMPDEVEEIISEAVREQYRIKSGGFDFAHKDAWNILKDISYFYFMFF